MTYHSTTVVGYLGKDPELRYTPNGQAVCSFSVAVNENFKNAQGEKISKTFWYRVSAWGNTAEACSQFLKKGALVLATGTLIADDATGGPKLWTGTDGTPHASFELRAQTVRFLSKSTGKSDPEQQDELAF